MRIKGHQVRLLREQRGYTLQDLANRTALSLSYLSEIERGAKRPSLKTLEKLAAALNIPKAQLIEDQPANTSREVGWRLRTLRSEKGLSLEELADMSGLSLSHLEEIESGTAYPGVGTIQRLARELGVVPQILGSGEGRSLGHKLRVLREEYGMTQAQLAQLSGVTAGLIGQIEQGKVQPSLKTLEKLAEVMGVSPCYFIVEPEAVDQVLIMMNPELRELLVHPNVQAVLGLVCNLNRKELQFILNFIQMYKRSGLG